MKISDYKDTWNARRRAKEYENENCGLKLVYHGVNDATFRFRYEKNAESKVLEITLKRWEMEELLKDIKSFFDSEIVKEFYKKERKEELKELLYLTEIVEEKEA